MSSFDATDPVVSVIIPTRDRAWCLADAIQSVLNQTFKRFELIVVDDGSRDHTAALVRQWSAPRYLRLERSQGVSAARNHGMEAARGRWICFLDSDDRWHPDKLARQWQWVETHPDCRTCYTDEIWIRRGVRVNPASKHRKFGGDVFRQCLPLCIISPSSVMIRRDVFADIGVFDVELPACEDYDLWLRLAARYPVDFIPEPLIVKTGGHADQLSRKYWGMDRFRVYALEKLLRGAALPEERRGWVLEMLAEKCRILSTGYRNRGKPGPAERYARAVADFEAALSRKPCDWKDEFALEKELLLPEKMA